MDPKFGQMLAAQNEEGYHQVLSQNLASTIDKKFWA
jgi:hypothetical protein